MESELFFNLIIFLSQVLFFLIFIYFCVLSVINEDVMKEGQEKVCNSNFYQPQLLNSPFILQVCFHTYTALLKYIFLNLSV